MSSAPLDSVVSGALSLRWNTKSSLQSPAARGAAPELGAPEPPPAPGQRSGSVPAHLLPASCSQRFYSSYLLTEAAEVNTAWFIFKTFFICF